MTIAEFHRLFALVANKTRNEYWTHEEIDDFANIVQVQYFSEIIGNLKAYQLGRPVPPIVYGQTSRTLAELNPFLQTISFYPTGYDPIVSPTGTTDGVLVLPADFEYHEGITAQVAGDTARTRPVMVLDGEQWAGRIDSALIPVTQLDPIAIYDGSGGEVNGYDVTGRNKIKFAPAELSGVVRYWRKPAKPNYVYTLNGRVETHDAASSTDLEWTEVSAMNILVRALALAGVPQADQALVQVMTQDKMQSE